MNDRMEWAFGPGANWLLFDDVVFLLFGGEKE